MIRLVPILGAVATLSACATPPPADDSFGSAVRNMQREQMFDPGAAARPAADAPNRTDGDRAARLMREHRGPGAPGADASDSQSP